MGTFFPYWHVTDGAITGVVAYFWIALSWAGLGLEAVVVMAILKNGWREFALFFAYAFSLAMATVIAALTFYLTHGQRPYALVYWLANIILDCLVVAVIVNLIYRALAEQDRRARLASMAACAACIFVPLLLAYDKRFGFWMTAGVRNLSFAAEILNLVLWMILVQHREVGSRFLWVSAGLGVQMTGQVLGHSLRLLSSHTAIWAPNLLLNICQFAALGMWLYAFCRADSVKKAVHALSPAPRMSTCAEPGAIPTRQRA